MSEGRYYRPWEVLDLSTRKKPVFRIVDKYHMYIMDLSRKDMAELIVSSINAFDSKEPGECVVVDKDKADLYQNSIECELIGLRQRVRCNVVKENAALEKRLEKEKANHARTGQELFSGINEIAGMMSRLAEAVAKLAQAELPSILVEMEIDLLLSQR